EDTGSVLVVLAPLGSEGAWTGDALAGLSFAHRSLEELYIGPLVPACQNLGNGADVPIFQPARDVEQDTRAFLLPSPLGREGKNLCCCQIGQNGRFLSLLPCGANFAP